MTSGTLLIGTAGDAPLDLHPPLASEVEEEDQAVADGGAEGGVGGALARGSPRARTSTRGVLQPSSPRQPSVPPPGWGGAEPWTIKKGQKPPEKSEKSAEAFAKAEKSEKSRRSPRLARREAAAEAGATPTLLGAPRRTSPRRSPRVGRPEPEASLPGVQPGTSLPASAQLSAVGAASAGLQPGSKRPATPKKSKVAAGGKAGTPKATKATPTRKPPARSPARPTPGEPRYSPLDIDAPED